MTGTFGPSVANQLEQLPMQQAKGVNSDLAKIRPTVNPNAPVSHQKTFLDQLREELESTGDLAGNLTEDVVGAKENINEITNMASSSYFVLNKESQFEQPLLDSSMDNIQSEDLSTENSQDSSLIFNSPQELQSLLDQNSQDPNFVNKLIESAPVDAQSLVKDSVSRYYEPSTDQSDKAILAAEIFKAIHGRGQGEDQVEATYVNAFVNNIVKEANSNIMKFAKQASKCNVVEKNTSYNLKKQAQFNGTGHTEFMNFGPESKRILPYSNTGVLANDYHVWIRARDHNFIMDDHAVDFDTFWRGNIMDKYSQPYRNDKGEWVGGYINKRFEVDRNIPEGNNLQLLPGQRRRPYLPEFATIEARMEASRAKFAKERGYEPTDDKAKAYNWKEAAVKKK